MDEITNEVDALAYAPTQENADRIHWWHTLTLPGGIVTKGHHDPSSAFKTLMLPDRLDGKRVADVGAWDGAFSFEMERRGALSVTAIDQHVWFTLNTAMHHGSPTGKRGFEFARKALNSHVLDFEVDVLALREWRETMHIAPYDIVLFLGVLYHMRHPLLALENVAAITAPGGLCVIETHLGADQYELTPAMEFYEDRELNNDPTNWVGPNPPAVCAMARAAGFATCNQVWRSGSRGVFHAVKA